MEQSLDLSQMKQNLYCSFQQHRYQPLDYLCLEYSCNSNPLICALCDIDAHFEHKKIPMKIFLHRLSSLRSMCGNLVSICGQIDFHLIKIQSIIAKHQKKFNNYLEVQQIYQKFKKQLCQQSMRVFKLSKDLKQMNKWNPMQLKQQLEIIIKKNYDALILNIESDNNKMSLIQSVIIAKKQILEGIVNDLQKKQGNNKITDQYVLGLFPLNSLYQGKFKLYFTQDLKGTCMTITESTKAFMQKSGSQRLIALQPSLEKNNRVKKWSVLVVKMASWVGVGICHINNIREANFHFNYSSTGHGSYLISSNGYSWSGYQPEYNSKLQPFHFTTGDIIHIQYNPNEKIIKFIKNTTDEKYQLDFQINGDPLHACINMTGIGDSVQILQ